MKIFILEDAPERMNWFLETFSDCDIDYTDDVHKGYEYLSSNSYDLIFLDRDLGHPKYTGEDLAWEMMEEKLSPHATVVVHTVNTRGQRVIPKYLKRYNKKVYQIPFPQLSKLKREDFV